jgi:hypothetical protein
MFDLEAKVGFTVSHFNPPQFDDYFDPAPADPVFGIRRARPMIEGY